MTRLYSVQNEFEYSGRILVILQIFDEGANKIAYIKIVVACDIDRRVFTYHVHFHTIITRIRIRFHQIPNT